MNEITGFQRDVLYVVAGLGDPKGMRVQDELEEYYGSSVLPARVYQNLDDLHEAGLIEKGERDSRTNYYRLTDAGRERIERRRAWEQGYVDDAVTPADD
ncbi:helix-turn-helix transcriptional regulator [Halarchaeum sp. CBA1220]|uniref:PadR family transcriptional regulator n=1 Tax=Halarchaeum sp. CBA1220 TaxID=1853682 RepID=UPI000F3AA2E6|nr:helix-turn-helix transcriptional regulator [Halarchaeum sp. CBA1220]QLC34002.1 helix-turn-helix transcriptional regulator [Halarchaeum sp. CBA1220]